MFTFSSLVYLERILNRHLLSKHSKAYQLREFQLNGGLLQVDCLTSLTNINLCFLNEKVMASINDLLFQMYLKTEFKNINHD